MKKESIFKVLDTGMQNERYAVRTDINRNERKKPESVKKRRKVDKKYQFTRETDV